MGTARSARGGAPPSSLEKKSPSPLPISEHLPPPHTTHPSPHKMTCRDTASPHTVPSAQRPDCTTAPACCPPPATLRPCFDITASWPMHSAGGCNRRGGMQVPIRVKTRFGKSTGLLPCGVAAARTCALPPPWPPAGSPRLIASLALLLRRIGFQFVLFCHVRPARPHALADRGQQVPARVPIPYSSQSGLHAALLVIVTAMSSSSPKVGAC